MRESEGLALRTVAECPAALVAAALNRGFEGYVLPFSVTPEAYERRFRGEHLDPFASRVLLSAGEPVGALLVTRRGTTARIGALGVAPELRSTGVGAELMDLALRESRARGDRRLLLEVIEQNPRAVAFYERLGFRRLRRLVGYRLPAETAAATPGGGHAGPGVRADAPRETLLPIEPRDVVRRFAAEGGEWPWMFAPETLAAAASPAAAFSLEDSACTLVADPDAASLSFLALHVRPDRRRQGWARRLLAALRARFPGRPFVFTVSLPEDLVPEFFVRTGWERLTITQFEMALEIGPLPEGSGTL